MVFKPINIARQSFVKTFTHGYAQSLVAASQSSSASQNTSFHTLSSNFVGLWAKSGSTQPPPSHVPPPSANHGLTAGHSLTAKLAVTDAPGHDGGLAAYYAAWNKHHRPEEKEWHQVQFAKRIGWKPPTTIPETPSKPLKHAAAATEASERPKGQLQRSRSTTAVDEYFKRESQIALESSEGESSERFMTRGETVVAKEDQFWQDLAHQVQDVSQEVISAASESLATSSSPATQTSSTQTPTTNVTYASGADTFTEQLVHLAESGRYAEIPPVFQAILLDGKQPTSSAYNALLLAAINLPKGKHQVVPKVLDVYSDMLHRRVAPDTATYAILVELLAARALDVLARSKELQRSQVRYGGSEGSESFLFQSDRVESQILSEDDSLSLAIRLFDTSVAVSVTHLFPAETYRLLITACAELGRIGDMVRIYADMESRKISPPTSIFAPMIQAFARTGDLRSAVECYDEYKGLAVAHDNGVRSIVRKDEEIYAAVVQAYELCGRSSGGMKFLGRIEDAMFDSPALLTIRDTIAMRALLPQWLSVGNYDKATDYALGRMSGDARVQALSAVCIDAADKNLTIVATETFHTLTTLGSTIDITRPAIALLALHVRNANFEAAHAIWAHLRTMRPSTAMIEPATMLALCAISSGNSILALDEVRDVFGQVRKRASNNSVVVAERIEEAIEVIGLHALKLKGQPAMSETMTLLHMMLENGKIFAPVAERLIAALGPNEISQMPWTEFDIVLQVQATLLLENAQLDVGHGARLVHMVELASTNGFNITRTTLSQVQRALENTGRADVLQNYQRSVVAVLSPQFTSPLSPTPITMGPTYDETFDPYASSTDFKGSAIIAEELEKAYGSHAAHLNEALLRFKNMRRIGRHPRYLTYAKLITSAAKENRMNLALEILEMARQDIPLIPNSRVVRHGWVAILDSVVGACLTVGKRDLAAQYHQQLRDMGAAPSANTFGLYITTLKESTKTFDEATEAVKIFHRATAEGVEPSSFLYNALIGKLGKARRIDDCLFYFAEMRNKGIRPTSVTYGTIVNALCRVSDDKFAEELFEEMESMPNYKPRPAPYNSLMQYFLTTKRDRSKVLSYFERMKANRIEPTMHTYKLLIDTYATLEPVNLEAAEGVLEAIRASGGEPEAVHYASLIHARGCVLQDLPGARATFDRVISGGRLKPQASLYQALFESMVANHEITATEPLLKQMKEQGVGVTPYIANTLIHGWATAENVRKAEEVFEALGRDNREPSTYEAMTRAYLAAEQHGNAMKVVGEALRRGYPSAVANKICDLVGGGKVVS